MNQTPAVSKFLTPELALQAVEVTGHEEESPTVSLVPPGYAPCMLADSREGCDGLAPPDQNLCKNCARR